MASSGSVEHVETQRGRIAIPSQLEARRFVPQVSQEESMLQIEEKLDNTLKLFEEARVRYEEARFQLTIIRETTKIDLPKPKEFKGATDARRLLREFYRQILTEVADMPHLIADWIVNFQGGGLKKDKGRFGTQLKKDSAGALRKKSKFLAHECNYGTYAILFMSSTIGNSSRLFYGCPYFK
ncbi:hypothetical protein PIB30_003739, partial [Stylosanthes scabra]|nr:hypothetical protein [Stylosanthes scabra]